MELGDAKGLPEAAYAVEVTRTGGARNDAPAAAPSAAAPSVAAPASTPGLAKDLSDRMKSIFNPVPDADERLNA